MLALAAAATVAPSAAAPGFAETAVMEALRAHVEALTETIGERSIRRPAALVRARDYIRGAFAAAGLDVTEQTYRYGELDEVANVIAAPPGAAGSEAFYVIGAHYDTVIGTPGADDNASGVAALLLLAERLGRDPPVPLRFVAFTLEEPPVFGTAHQGSRVYAKALAGERRTVRGAIILEMIGFTSPRQGYPPMLRWLGYPDRGDFIGVVGNRQSKALGRALVSGLEKGAGLPAESLFVFLNGRILPDTRFSDHASFWDEGWPAVMITDTAYFRNPHYHGPTDRAETLDYAFMAKVVQGVDHAVRALKPGR